MKKKRLRLVKILALTAFLLTGSMVKAQKSDTNYFDRSATTVHADDDAVVHNLGMWVRSHFLDNWYVDFQAGGNMYGGYDDWTGPTFDHIGYSLEAKFGRWVFPKLGYRFGIGYGSFNGYLRQDVYNMNPQSIAFHAGAGSNYSGLPGYYTANGDYLRQHWNYGILSGDMMVRLVSVKGYERNQAVVPYVMLGVSFLTAFTDPNNVVNGDVDQSPKSKYGAGVHGGIGLNARIAEHWSIYAEARASVQSGTFDREYVSYQGADGEWFEKPTFNEDFPIFGFFGVEYRFNFRRESKRAVWDQTVENTNNNLDNKYKYNYNTTNIIDTIYSFDTVSEFSPEYDSLLARRARQRIQDQMDSLRRAFERDCNDANLGDILSRHMLPYEMVFFKLDKWDILKSEEVKIRKMAAVMRNFPDDKFLLIGSADSKTGTVKRNDFLSVNRADVVYNKLVHEYGINPEQLKRVYMGGIMDFDPFELNRATVIIMDHPKVMEEFNKLKGMKQAGGSSVDMTNETTKTK